jgi:hypothetical protein
MEKVYSWLIDTPKEELTIARNSVKLDQRVGGIADTCIEHFRLQLKCAKHGL